MYSQLINSCQITCSEFPDGEENYADGAAGFSNDAT